MPAPKKYPDELRERATRLAIEARRDPASAVGAIRDQVRAAIDAGAVTVLVSHRLSTVRMADLIVVLGDGRVAEREPTSN